MMFAGPIKRGVAEATNTNDKIWSKLILNKRYRGAKSKLNSNYNRGIVDHDQCRTKVVMSALSKVKVSSFAGVDLGVNGHLN